LQRVEPVIVADDQVLSARSGFRAARGPGPRRPKREIAEVPDLIVGTHGLVPVRDKRLVVLVKRPEGPVVEAQHAAIAEMRIAREEDRHRVLPLTAAGRT
jgi:hypothetical protein